jgi:xyloglucan-specific exo-beta-1,4-glucanase
MAAGEYTGPYARGGAVLRSTDRGATWLKAELPVKIGGNEDGRNTGERLVVDPAKGAVLFLGAKDGLYRSADHGQTWSRVAGFPRVHVTLAAFDPVEKTRTGETAIVYAGFATEPKDGRRGGGLLVSTDGGVSWGLVNGQPKGLVPHHLALDAKGGVYVAYGNGLGPNGVTDGAVWKMDPDTGAWADITPVKPGAGDVFGYGGLSLDPSRPGVIVVSTLDRWAQGDDVFRSVDGGRSWKALRDKSGHDTRGAPWIRGLESKAGRAMGHWIGDIDIDPTNPDEAIYVTGYGLWRTQDLTEADRSGRTHWRFDDEGLEETVALELVSPPGLPLVSTIGDIGGFRHDDLNSAARSRYFDPHGGTNRGLDYAALAPDILVRTSDPTPTAGFRSTDGGKTWKAFASSPPRDAHIHTGRIALSADGKRMVWAMRNAAPYVSSDDGRTWRPVQGVSHSDRPDFTPASDRVNPLRFYVYDAAQGAVLASADGGETFKVAARDLPRGGPLKAVPGIEGELWLPTAQGLMRSTNGGDSFKAVGGVDEAGLVGFGKAAPGQTHPAVFVWGKVGGVEGVFRSDDVGKTWIKLHDERWGFAELRALSGDPNRFGRVYLGVHGRGILYGDPQAPASSPAKNQGQP